MKIDEKLDKMKSELTKVLKECASNSKEEAIKLLEEVGLDNDSATKLLEAFWNMKSAKNTVENVWYAARDDKSGVDFSTSIRRSLDTEIRLTIYFDSVSSRCAFLMAIKTIEPNEINDEILDKLYEEGIHENEITNPALKTTYHYYSESKEKDKQLTMDAELVDTLNKQLKSTERAYAVLKDNYNTLQSNYENLQKTFKERIAAAEKHYQAALSQIATLKDKVSQLQEKGIFRTIGDKLTKLFGNKREELPEATSKIPDTLYESPAEKMGLRVPNEEDLLVNTNSNYEQIKTVSRTDKDARS